MTTRAKVKVTILCEDLLAATVLQCHDILYGPSSDLAEKLRVNLGLLYRSLYRRPENLADDDARETTTKG